MKLKEIKKNIIHELEWIGFKLGIKILSFLSRENIYRMGKTFGTLAFVFIRKYRRTTLENLNIVFKGKRPQDDINQIAKRSIQEMFISGSELWYFCQLSRQEHNRLIKIEGLENLDRALSFGKGVIGLSAHLSNFPLVSIKLAALGYNVGFIIRRQRDPRMESMLLKFREGMGIKTIYSIPRTTCVAQSLSHLRDNGILIIELDQNFGADGGIFINFLGRTAATAPGPVVFSMRTGAKVVPMFLIRYEDLSTKVIIEPHIELEVTGDRDKDILTNISKFTKIIELYVLKYPNLWSWSHKRWKSQPSNIKDNNKVYAFKEGG